jgi:hypothetical protein
MPDPGLVTQQIEQLFVSADTSRLRHEGQWNTNWNLYNNDYDWRRKASWQSQTPIPKVPMLVDFASDEIAGAIQATGRYFVFEAPGQEGKRRAAMGEAITRDWLQRPDVRLSTKFGESTRGAMLCASGILKVYWGASGLEVDVVDPYDFWVDPEGSGRYAIHRSVVDYDRLLAMADEGMYDKEVVQRVTGDTGTDEDHAWRQRSGLNEPIAVSGRRRVELLEFWGYIPDVNGEPLEGCEDCWCVLADRQHLIRAPEPNPFWHGKWPFVRFHSNPVPFSPYGKALISDISGMAKQYTELGNLVFDAAILDAIPIWEVNQSAMAYEAQTIRIHPGMQLARNGVEPILQAAQKPYTASNLALPVWSRWGKELENQSGVTQDIMGHVGGGPRRTATEASGQKQQSAKFLSNLAKNIEVNGVAPLADMSLRTIVQFMPSFMYYTQRYRELLGPQASSILAGKTNEERYQYLCTQHTVRGRGVAGVFTRVEDLGRILQLMQVLQMFPQYAARVNDEVVLRKFLEGVGWEADDVMLTDPQEIAQKMQMLQAQQQQQEALRGSGQGGPAWQNPVEQEQTTPRLVGG